jgi:hypothetical protein
MGIMLRMRALPAGFIAPCLPTKTDKLPSGDLWLHDRVTGDVGMTAVGEGNAYDYVLKCTPTQRMFRSGSIRELLQRCLLQSTNPIS